MDSEKIEKIVSGIFVEVAKHTQAFKELATKKELDERINTVIEGQDTIMVILERLDQERHFTFKPVKRLDEKTQRLDSEVKKHREEIEHIKEVLKV